MQVSFVIGGVAVLVLMPPAEGTMLLMPLDPAARPAALAVGLGAPIVGRGRWRNTVVVRGRADTLVAPLLRRGVLVLAAPAVMCGEATA